MLVLSPQIALAGSAASTSGTSFLKTLDRMMVELAPLSAYASATVRRDYLDYLDLLVLDELGALEEALTTGGLVPLPAEPERFNLRLRTGGHSPIAEKDLANQAAYLSARPAAVGVLLDIASRVKSGPLEITSLVRHSEYQEALRSTNVNATTSVPMHTMGLAFDIALVNSSLETVHEIRDVLRAMQDAGDILFIGERKQLVFHVVPHPSRLGYYSEVYAHAMADGLPSDHRVLRQSLRHFLSPYSRPVVEASVTDVRPTDDHADEWRVASEAEAKHPPTLEAVYGDIASERRGVFHRIAARCMAFVTGLLQSTRSALA